MTTAAWVLLAVAGGFAVGDWIAVGRGSLPLEYVCKPAATAALVATAAVLDPLHADTRAWFVAALVLCLLGDVFLMLPGDRFVPGLGSFLVGQLLFAVGFFLHPGDAGAYAIGLVVAGVGGGRLLGRFVGALRRSGHGELVAPVAAYFLAIATMVVSGFGTWRVAAIVGAVLFLVSDSLIAETRFVGPRGKGAPVAIMVTYHLALAALVLSLV
jgi:uncharacterized membrane protein YhhN